MPISLICSFGFYPHSLGKRCVSSRFNRVQFVVTPWSVAHEASLSMGFSRQEYWSGLPFPSPGDLPDPGIEPTSLASLAFSGGFLITSATWEAPSKRYMMSGWISLGGQCRPHEYWVSHITLVYLEVHEYLLPLGPWSMFSNTYFTNFFYCCCFVAKSCPTICNPMDCRPPGSSVHGFFPARILGWTAISFSRGSSQSRDQAKVSCIGRC